MSPPSRKRLSSTGDSSAPPSDGSDASSDRGSNSDGPHAHRDGHSPVCPEEPFWTAVADEAAVLQRQCVDALQQQDCGELQEYEMQQIESFFSGLGTEVSHVYTTDFCQLDQKIIDIFIIYKSIILW